MSMLTLIQSFCRRTNISVPNTVLGSTDPLVLQVLALLEEEGQDLATRGDWQVLTKEATHTTLAAEDQGALTSIAGSDFSHIVQGTLWDRTGQDPIEIVDPTDWQQIKATLSAAAYPYARIRGGNLLVTPAPSAGDTYAFEYISNSWISNAAGDTYYSEFNADTDLVLLPEKIIKMGLRWRWKKEKGFDYDEDFRTYEMMVSKALGSDGLKRNLNMGDGARTRGPRVVTPDGSWSL